MPDSAARASTIFFSGRDSRSGRASFDQTLAFCRLQHPFCGHDLTFRNRTSRAAIIRFPSLARLARHDEEQAVPDFSAKSGSFQRHSSGRHDRNDCHDAFPRVRKARRPRHQPLPFQSRNHHKSRRSLAGQILAAGRECL